MKTNKSLIERFNEKIDRHENGCWNWVGSISTSGYGCFNLNGKIVRAHRFIWSIEFGAIPENLHVLHNCDNRKCVNPKHMFLGTNLDNVHDKVAKNRQHKPKGLLNGKTKLSEQDVRSIRNDKRVQQVIANEYGIYQTLVSKIQNGRLWSHLV